MALKAYAPHTFGTIADWKTLNRHRAIGRGKETVLKYLIPTTTIKKVD